MLKTLLPENFGERDSLRHVGHARQTALHGAVRLLVWNILKGRRRDFPDDFKDLIADRDLVMLQEAVFNAPSDSLFAGQRIEWIMARSFREPRGGIEHGVKTGCVCAAETTDFYRSPHSEPVTQTQKLLLSTSYPISSGDHQDPERLLVLNMHAINFVTVRKYLDQLDQLAFALTHHVGPVILAGDFNTWSLRRRDSFFDLARDAALHEVPLERRSRVSQLAMHLDHVFYRGLRLRQAESLGHITSSDHAPITATFDLL